MADKEMRAVYTETLIKLAEKDDRIVILEADLMKATGTGAFYKKFPERTFNVGVAESNMVGVAAGLSASGKIPFAATFGCFASRRAYDQFYISCNYAKLNVKLVGTDPGVTAAFNGGTHMPFEDAGIIRNIPGVVIFEPCDPVSLEKLLEESVKYYGSTYMRLHRKPLPKIYDDNEKFELGKAKVLRDGKDISIFAYGGVMIQESLKAADILKNEGISVAVIDMHTIKPLDTEMVIKYAKETGAIVTCENHNIINGLGSAVAEFLSENFPIKMKRVGVNDEFGEVGTVDYLQERFKLTATNIVEQSKNLLKEKK